MLVSGRVGSGFKSDFLFHSPSNWPREKCCQVVECRRWWLIPSGRGPWVMPMRILPRNGRQRWFYKGNLGGVGATKKIIPWLVGII